jgi:hypothetical protein
MPPLTDDLLQGQALHLGVLLPASALALLLAVPPEAADGNDPSHAAVVSSFQLCVGCSVVHQLGMTAAWRAELHLGSACTRLCGGRRWLAQRLTGFFDTSTFGMALRAFVAVARADRGSWFAPSTTHLALAGVLGAVALGALGSALVLLGPSAISGADHFRTPGVPPPPLVRTGIYNVCDHPLFYLGMLLLWALALGSGSGLAFVLAGFMHASALAFLHGTEIPDILTIYGPANASRRAS